MRTAHTLLCCGTDRLHPYSSGLFHWHWGIRMIAPVPTKQHRRERVNKTFEFVQNARIILWMRPANERRRYIVTSPLIGWAHSQNNPWNDNHFRLRQSCDWHSPNEWQLKNIGEIPIYIYLTTTKTTEQGLCLRIFVIYPCLCTTWWYRHSNARRRPNLPSDKYTTKEYANRVHCYM